MKPVNGMKNSSLFGTVLIIITTLLLVASTGAAGLYFFKEASDRTDTDYFVTEMVISDGFELNDEELEQYFGVKSLSDVMSIYLKDTGDCGLWMTGNGLSCSWEKKGDKHIVVDLQDQTIKLKKRWEKWVYNTTVGGKDMEIVLDPAEKIPTCFKEHPELTFGLNYSNKDTEQLSNFMLDGYYLIDDEMLYGKFFDGAESVLGFRTIKGGDEPKVGKLNVIDRDGQAKFLVRDGKYIYYLWAPSNGSTESIRRVLLSTGDVKVLREGDVDYVQLRYGKIYFTDANNRFCVMDRKGKHEKVVIDREVYMPYIIDKNWAIYQDDKDKERLHLSNLGTDYDLTLSKERTYAWVIQGRKLFYTSTSAKEDEQKHKCKLHMLGIGSIKNIESTDQLETEVADGYMGDVFALNKEYILGGDGKEKEVDSWKTFSNKLYKDEAQTEYLMFIYGNDRIRGHTDGKGGFKEIRLDNIKSGAACDIIQ